LILECGGAAGDEHPRAFRIGVDGGGAHTTIRFANGPDVDLRQASTMAQLEWLVRPRLTVFASAGALLGGTVRAAGVDHELRPGWLAGAGVAWLAVAETGRRPFVSASAMLGYLAAHTKQADSGAEVPWRAGDARIGVTVGKSLGPLRPYLVGRAFGGPVSWRDGGQSLTGNDAHHYQVGAGVAFSLPAYLDASVEAAPLGEQGLAAGLGYRF
jgi:hypothetical protein